MIVKVINENMISDDLSRIKIKLNKIWGQSCVVNSITDGEESRHTLNGILRNVLSNAITADKIVIITSTDDINVPIGTLYTGTSYNRLVRIEEDICQYLNKEIYYESDLDKMIEEKEKENASKELDNANVVHDSCMHRTACPYCFLRAVSDDAIARIHFGPVTDGRMCFIEHAQNEEKDIEKVPCIAEQCIFFKDCFVYEGAKLFARFEGTSKDIRFVCKRDGGPVPSIRVNF